MSYSGDQAVAWAKTQVGFHEGPNNANPFSAWQYGGPNNPWCASFQCRAEYEGGYRFVGCTYGERGEAYTPTEALRAKQQGTWRDKTWRAQPGDAVLFDWKNDGLIDHVELVVYDDGIRLITIGGNTSDGVYFRTRDRTYVAGFWALSQDPQAKPVVDPKVLGVLAALNAWEKDVAEHPLELGAKGPRVKVLNDLLLHRGLVARTGSAYGKDTRAGVHHLKLIRQKKTGEPDVDGRHVAGPAAHFLLHL